MSGHSLGLHEVPLVGQLVKAQGFTIVLQAACQCGSADPIQLIYQSTLASGPIATPGICPACRTVYAVARLRIEGQGVVFDLQVQRPMQGEPS